jgi:hypothetical protein
LGIATTTSETAFTQSAETVYDFVTNPENWTNTRLSRASSRPHQIDTSARAA